MTTDRHWTRDDYRAEIARLQSKLSDVQRRLTNLRDQWRAAADEAETEYRTTGNTIRRGAYIALDAVVDALDDLPTTRGHHD